MNDIESEHPARVLIGSKEVVSVLHPRSPTTSQLSATFVPPYLPTQACQSSRLLPSNAHSTTVLAGEIKVGVATFIAERVPVGVVDDGVTGVSDELDNLAVVDVDNVASTVSIMDFSVVVLDLSTAILETVVLGSAASVLGSAILVAETAFATLPMVVSVSGTLACVCFAVVA
jgi:hypothetical protein